MNRRLATFGMFFGAGMFFPSLQSMAHDWYVGLQNKRGWICCNKDDFKPVQAWQDDAANWHALYPNADGTKTEYIIEEWQMVDDKFNKEPFQAHLAVMNGQVRCFLRKAAGG